PNPASRSSTPSWSRAASLASSTVRPVTSTHSTAHLPRRRFLPRRRPCWDRDRAPPPPVLGPPPPLIPGLPGRVPVAAGDGPAGSAGVASSGGRPRAAAPLGPSRRL